MSTRRFHQLTLVFVHLDQLEKEEKLSLLYDKISSIPQEVIAFWQREKSIDHIPVKSQCDMLGLIRLCAKHGAVEDLHAKANARLDDNDDDFLEIDSPQSISSQLEDIAGDILIHHLVLDEMNTQAQHDNSSGIKSLFLHALETLAELSRHDVSDFLKSIRRQLEKHKKSLQTQQLLQHVFVLRVAAFLVDKLAANQEMRLALPQLQGMDADMTAEMIFDDATPLDRMLGTVLRFQFVENAGTAEDEDEQDGLSALLLLQHYTLQGTDPKLCWMTIDLLWRVGMASKSMCLRVIPMLERALYLSHVTTSQIGLATFVLSCLWELLFVWYEDLAHLVIDAEEGLMLPALSLEEAEAQGQVGLLSLLLDFLNAPLVEQQLVSATGICRLLLLYPNDVLSASSQSSQCSVEQLLCALTLKYCMPSTLAAEYVASSLANAQQTSKGRKAKTNIEQPIVLPTEVELDAKMHQSMMQLIVTFLQKFSGQQQQQSQTQEPQQQASSKHQEQLANACVFLVLNAFGDGVLPLASNENACSDPEAFELFQHQVQLLMSMLSDKQRYLPMIVESIWNNIEANDSEHQVEQSDIENWLQ